MDPASQPVDLSPVQELVAVLRDVGILGLLILFVIGLFRGWWTMKVQTDMSTSSRELNKVVLSFPGARRRLRRRRR